jgi:hypothetical protein
MKRQLLVLLTLTALLGALPLELAEARHGFGRGAGARLNAGRGRHVGHHHGHGHGFGGFGLGGFFLDDDGIGDLYRQLYNNLPYFALHPPVYYSYPVPRTYGFSPFAYWPSVMTPDPLGVIQPMEIINPYVPSSGQPTKPKADQAAAASARPQPQPLVIYNPYVGADKSLARASE